MIVNHIERETTSLPSSGTCTTYRDAKKELKVSPKEEKCEFENNIPNMKESCLHPNKTTLLRCVITRWWCLIRTQRIR